MNENNSTCYHLPGSLLQKVSACCLLRDISVSARISHPVSLIPSPFKKNVYVFLLGFPSGSVVKNLPVNAADAGWIPGSGRSPAGGNGNLQQCSCLENPMDREARCTVHGIPKSQIRLSMQMPNGPYLCRMTTVSSESGVQRQ